MSGRRRFVSVTSTFKDKSAIIAKSNPGMENMRTVAGVVAREVAREVGLVVAVVENREVKVVDAGIFTVLVRDDLVFDVDVVLPLGYEEISPSVRR